MFELAETILDIASWILAGIFLGLTALGGVYTYNSYARPPTPNLQITPIQTRDQSQNQTKKSFRSLEQFHLVQKYSQINEGTEEESSGSNGETNGTSPPPAPSDELSETDLPYKLLGTVTGSGRFQYARVQNLEKRKSKTLKVGDTWGAMKVEKIQDSQIVIRNTRTNRVEKLSLRSQDQTTGQKDRRTP